MRRKQRKNKKKRRTECYLCGMAAFEVVFFTIITVIIFKQLKENFNMCCAHLQKGHIRSTASSLGYCAYGCVYVWFFIHAAIRFFIFSHMFPFSFILSLILFRIFFFLVRFASYLYSPLVLFSFLIIIHIGMISLVARKGKEKNLLLFSLITFIWSSN